MPRIKIKHGLTANLPTTGMLAGEQFFTTDRGALHVATGDATRMPVVPPIDDLVAVPAIDGAADLLLIHDASESGAPKEKKVSIDTLKAALNIPPASTDEKVAVAAGGTAGYLWGSDGTDGVLRMGPSMTWSKDPGNGFVTLNVDVIDCGTF